MSQPFSAYVICGTPRSGSTLLCEMLAASGVAGRPHSFYRQQSITHWADRWGVDYAGGVDTRDFDQRYLTAMLREGTTRTGVFGIRIMWGSVAEASMRLERAQGGNTDVAERFAQAFGPTLYIHLTRNNKVAQAVSLLRAERSGLWHLSADGSVLEGADKPEAVAYDADRLAAIVAELESDDAAWEGFFAERQIKPLRLVYETMTADPQNALASILSALGRDPAIASTVPVKTAKMGDATNTEWAERFERERRPA
ncbi:Stf0 family sulfotransferase [Devosia lacusdianchii]|uniref:Stf0 family sulfotransferase n=1 Tax=Devosia lacusdianchii TaxID=2917991 RepID=UPI001F06761C|nr:Stf0 family sulfotransferase [Devosia sp. JXJ CY 41]